jgi:hypothetical protein
MEMLFKRLRTRAVIQGKRISPQILRHTFAMNYLIKSNDPFSLQELLGHEGLTTVRSGLNRKMMVCASDETCRMTEEITIHTTTASTTSPTNKGGCSDRQGLLEEAPQELGQRIDEVGEQRGKQ